MNKKQLKRLHAYADKYGEDFDALKQQYKKAPTEYKKKLQIHIKHYVKKP